MWSFCNCFPPTVFEEKAGGCEGRRRKEAVGGVNKNYQKKIVFFYSFFSFHFFLIENKTKDLFT